MPKRKVCRLNSTLRFFRDCILLLGARPEARLPVAISSRLKKDSLKTGYSMAHIRHESETQKYRRLALEGQSGESARVFVQVKRENGTKKGLSFWVWVPFYDLSF